MDSRAHWQNVYATKAATEVSWYAPHLSESLRLIKSVTSAEARLIDVGGGASTLVDDLLAAGYQHLTVLDISASALEAARRRLGPREPEVTWLTADVTTASLPESSYELWHDRATFHFMVSEAARGAYVKALRRALVPSGHAIIGTFALDGPPQCSGLDVVRYDAGGLLRELGDEFSLLEEARTTHVTPAGREQRFITCCFRRNASA